MVSIIVPCYNGKKFIKRCFNSILDQSYNDIQLIIVNDGSTDNSENIILDYEDKFIEKDIKFEYLYKENGGPSSAINEGLKLVKGKYLTLLDIDDYIMKESIELKVDFLEKNNDYDIVRTNGYYVTEDNLEKEEKLFIVNQKEKENIYIFDDLITAKTNNWAGSYMVRSNKLFEFYKDRNIYESRYGQNLQILLPLAYRGKSGFIDIPLMKYIKQEESLSQVKTLESQINNLLGYKDIRLQLVNEIVDKNEKENYVKVIESNYARLIMELAVFNKIKEKANESYNILKALDDIKLEDNILYFRLENKMVHYILRLYKKIKNILCKGFVN